MTEPGVRSQDYLDGFRAALLKGIQHANNLIAAQPAQVQKAIDEGIPRLMADVAGKGAQSSLQAFIKHQQDIVTALDADMTKLEIRR